MPGWSPAVREKTGSAGRAVACYAALRRFRSPLPAFPLDIVAPAVKLARIR
jgi:hypothetical protein